MARDDVYIPPVSEEALSRATDRRLDPAGPMDEGSRALLDKELKRLQQRREGHGLAPVAADSLTGIALSGGGIRSATFALGVLQALAKQNLLRRFDYLSSVSGGGYIGTALTWWLSDREETRPGGERRFGVGPTDFPYGTASPTVWRGRIWHDDSEAAFPLEHLRKHGNYLTPGGGIDALSGVAVVLRGAITSLLVWLPLLIVAMVLLLALLGPAIGLRPPTRPVSSGALGPLELGLIVVGALVAATVLAGLGYLYWRDIWSYRQQGAQPPGRSGLMRAVEDCRPKLWLALLVAFPVALTLAAFARRNESAWSGLELLLLPAAMVAGAFVLLCGGYALATGLALRYRRGGSGAIDYAIRRLFERWASVLLPVIAGFALLGLVPVTWCAFAVEGACEGSPLGAGPTGGIFALLAGIAGSGLAFLASGGKLVTTILGREVGLPPRLTAGLAGVLVVFGALLVAYDVALRVVGLGLLGALVALALLGAILYVFGWRSNINHVSVQRFYRDRLMEAFMAHFRAVREDRTGPAHDGADRMRLHEANPRGPYPIINTNVVLVNAKERRHQLRGGDNFILAPDFCGSNATGWRATRHFMDDRMTLATAMATSGAAANPNTGVGGVGLTRSRAVSGVMGLLGLRLGYWVPHPDPKREPASARPHQIWPGSCTFLPCGHKETSEWQELSDGGHFDNLGLYELVRRRLRLILLVDAGRDTRCEFGDLQVALRRIGEDFGARVAFDDALGIEGVIPRSDTVYPPDTHLAERGHMLATITYADGNTGLLVYLKTTLVAGLPLELLGYRSANPDFPDEATVDQFFDEDQFEAYRELGYRIARDMLDDARVDLAGHLPKLCPDAPERD